MNELKELLVYAFSQNLQTSYQIVLGIGIALMFACLLMMAYGLYLIIFGGNE